MRAPVLTRTLALALVLTAGAAGAEDLAIGHLSLAKDPRYVQDWGYARLITPPPTTTAQAAQMAVKDMSFTADALGLKVTLDAQVVAEGDLAATAAAMVAKGEKFLVLDLPAADVTAVAQALKGQDVLLVNATAPEDSLRTACIPNMLSSGPSNRQLMDSFAQYLRSMNWLNILVLVGETPSDAILADAFQASAERLRLTVVDRRTFTLAADPQNREGNNVKLLTGGVDYDVVFVADTRGEFGRYIPYATQEPRPVIGSIGLTAASWHWAFERDGATQVSSRFDKAFHRKIQPADWDVWAAVKSIQDGVMKTGSQDPATVRAYLISDKFKLDGSKGVTLNYRAWDGQMRQPIILGTSDAAIAVAPIKGFTHQTNTLDTLGTDEAEFACD